MASPRRLSPDERRAMAQVLARRYRDGASIRALAADFGRSYGFVQRLLGEAGVVARPRGGADPASPQTRAAREQAEEPDLGEELRLAEEKVRKAEKRLAKAERSRARLKRADASKKERRAARKKVAKRSRKADKAAQRLERIREQVDSARGA